MSEPGSPMGFRAPDPEAVRDGWRLLLVVLSIVLLGAAALAAVSVGLA